MNEKNLTPLLVKLALQETQYLRDRFVQLIRDRQMPYWLPLARKTIENKRRQGVSAPERPLVATGELVRRLSQAQVKVETDGRKVTGRIILDDWIDSHERQIPQDQFLGANAVGTNRRTIIPARKLEPPEFLKREVRDRATEFFRDIAKRSGFFGV